MWGETRIIKCFKKHVCKTNKANFQESEMNFNYLLVTHLKNTDGDSSEFPCMTKTIKMHIDGVASRLEETNTAQNQSIESINKSVAHMMQIVQKIERDTVVIKVPSIEAFYEEISMDKAFQTTSEEAKIKFDLPEEQQNKSLEEEKQEDTQVKKVLSQQVLSE